MRNEQGIKFRTQQEHEINMLRVFSKGNASAD